VNDELYVESEGRGAPVVLLHGWGMHGGIWDDCAAALADDWRVSKVDLPGHGRSVPRPGIDRIEGLAEIVARHAPRRMTLVGWSLGGMVAMDLAQRQPRRVERLVLVATTPRFVAGPDWDCGVDPQVLESFGARLGEDYRRTVRDFLTLQVRGDEHATQLLRSLRRRLFAHGDPDPAALAQGLTVLAETDLRATIGRLRMPTLIISGDRDRLTPPEAGRWLADAIPDARHLSIGGASHAPFISHAEAFLDAVGEFLGTAG
jgi:pimeloyl-[acyl-carrier protein] methyl ester esterase